MNGTKAKSQPTMGSSTVKDNAWKREPQVTNHLKDIILEAGPEQKREEEEDLRKKKNLIHKKPLKASQGTQKNVIMRICH